MAVTWTEDQRRVIDTRKKNILVSAAAGSGKTAVLVERIIKRITDEQHPVDVDRLLVVTFTNAAASEMRERIGDAIEAALEREPENHHLQRQQSLIHNAQITTIDSFCLYIVRNYFHTIDLEPGFRIADEIAKKVGIHTDSDFRIQSGILYTLLQASGEGHTFLPEEELTKRAGELLGVTEEAIEKQYMDLSIERKIRFRFMVHHSIIRK